MTTFYPLRISCPQCSREFTVELTRTIPASRLPEVRQQILDSTFQLFECPACQAPVTVEAPVVYVDFERGHYVAMEASTYGDWHGARNRHIKIFADCFVYAPAVAQEIGRPLTRRLVFGWRALREKVVLWGAGLDDVLVEGLKGDALAALGIGIDETVLRLSRIVDGGHLMFGMFEPPPRLIDDGTGEPVAAPLATAYDFLTVPAEKYRSAAADPASTIRRYPWLGDEWLVDIHSSAGDVYR